MRDCRREKEKRREERRANLCVSPAAGQAGT